jgi:hypothetical protein
MAGLRHRVEKPTPRKWPVLKLKDLSEIAAGPQLRQFFMNFCGPKALSDRQECPCYWLGSHLDSEDKGLPDGETENWPRASGVMGRVLQLGERS